MNSNIQKLCAWSGMVGILLFFIGLLFAQFVPPPGPSLTQEQVVALYQQNTTGIRIGMIFMLASGMFMAPQIGLITLHLKRVEGINSLMSYAQLSIGSVGILFFILPAILFIAAAFRPDRSPELIYLLNDLAWITALIGWPPAFMQNIAIGVAIVQDRNPDPIFPRWLGFFNFWVALLFVPASLLAFLKTGPFAWSGLFAFWIPGSLFGIWCIVMLAMLLKAIDRQQREAGEQLNPS